MPDLLLITGASAMRGTMELYLRQLAEAKIDVEIFPIITNKCAFDVKFKVEAIRWAGNTFSKYGKIIMSDAFDVTFYGSREDVLAKIPDGPLWAAEKNCYPDVSVVNRVPAVGPWRFCNGGLLCGTPQSLVAWADRADKHPRCHPGMTDQQFMNERLADRSPLCSIDSSTSLFFCLYGGYDELEFEDGKPVNRNTGTHPNFIHANGSWPAQEMFDKYERSISG